MLEPIHGSVDQCLSKQTHRDIFELHSQHAYCREGCNMFFRQNFPTTPELWKILPGPLQQAIMRAQI